MSPKRNSEARPRRTSGAAAETFFAGVLITGPISITLYLVWLFISYVDNVVNP